MREGKVRLEKEEKPRKYLVCHTRMKSSKYHCPLEESAGEKKKNVDKKHRGEVREKVGNGKSKHGSQKNPCDYNSACENCPCDL